MSSGASVCAWLWPVTLTLDNQAHVPLGTRTSTCARLLCSAESVADLFTEWVRCPPACVRTCARVRARG
jgi:hypothetical protein